MLMLLTELTVLATSCRYRVDFGKEKEIFNWILSYLDAEKAGLLTHLLDDGGVINIVYQNYDWSINS